jgi:hypothetical protein
MYFDEEDGRRPVFRFAPATTSAFETLPALMPAGAPFAVENASYALDESTSIQERILADRDELTKELRPSPSMWE